MTSVPNEPERQAPDPGFPEPGVGGASPAPKRAEGDRRGEEGSEGEGIRFTDNRRIDPETFQARPKPKPNPEPKPKSRANPGVKSGAKPGSEIPDDLSGLADAGEAPSEPTVDPAVTASVAADERVVELTADLQRLSAEYANYRRRVDRDRKLQTEVTTANLMTALLPILDDIERAEAHGELDGGFKAVGEAIRSLAESNGVERFGAEGEAFDPNVHEAMMSETSPDVTEPTVTSVFQVGYRIGDRVLRASRVGVTDAE